MKEIIYIQAGNLANHIGTHFWNTQESYFTYEEGEDPIVEHDISFREGSTLKVSSRRRLDDLCTWESSGAEGRINILSQVVVVRP